MNARKLWSVVSIVALLLVCGRAVAQGLNTNDPTLPPIGAPYLTAAQVHATYSAGSFSVVLSQVQHQALAGAIRVPVGGGGVDEQETFNSNLNALTSVNGGSTSPFSGSGQVITLVHNKTGNVTGTFNTEMLSMSLTGTGGVMIRESPTLASTGQTTIAPIGGGNFHIDSFFDVFTELSIDGGQSWIPQSDGPTRVSLSPEPGMLSALSLLAVGLLRIRRNA